MDESTTDGDWRRWVEQYTPRFLLFARQKTRTEGDAQDLVQEAVLEASHRQTDHAPPPAALVFATIQRRAIDLARRNDRRLDRELVVMADAETCWFDASLEDREMKQMLENTLKRLPELYREVVMLKIWGDLTFAEVAEVLGIPPNTAASRYRYGLAELRKLMKGVLA